MPHRGRSSDGQRTEMACFRAFETGATGLEPATSGVTGRSWSSQDKREWAGIFPGEQDFSPPGLRGLPGTCGSFRRPPAGYSRDGSLSDLATPECFAVCAYQAKRGRRQSTIRPFHVLRMEARACAGIRGESSATRRNRTKRSRPEHRVVQQTRNRRNRQRSRTTSGCWIAARVGMTSSGNRRLDEATSSTSSAPSE